MLETSSDSEKLLTPASNYKSLEEIWNHTQKDSGDMKLPTSNLSLLTNLNQDLEDRLKLQDGMLISELCLLEA